jgi:hypothetical protein
MNYFVTLTEDTGDDLTDTAQTIEAPDAKASIAQAVRALAATYGPEAKVRFENKDRDSGAFIYALTYPKAGCIGVTEAVTVKAVAETCQVYVVEGREEIDAPTPAKAAELYAAARIPVWRDQGDYNLPGDAYVRDTVLVRSWPDKSPDNWIIKVFIVSDVPGDKTGVMCHLQEEIKVRALVPSFPPVPA